MTAVGTSTGEEVAHQQDEPKGYVICITNKTSTRRLHLLGACWRIPGISYRQFELMGEEMPDPQQYNAICGDCWKKKEDEAATNIDFKDGTDSETTSSSSDEDKELI